MANTETQPTGIEGIRTNFREYLDKPEFNSFLNKNADAEERIGDNEYLRERVEVYENLKTAKETLKKLISGETGKDYADLVHGPFFEKLEKFAAGNTSEFNIFSDKVKGYLEAKQKRAETEASKSQTEASVTQRTEALEMSLKKDRGVISMIFSPKKWKKSVNESRRLSTEIDQLKLKKDTDTQSIQDFQNQIDQMRADLQENDGLDLLKAAHAENVASKVAEAIQSGNHKALVKERAALIERMAKEETLITEENQEEMLALIKQSFEQSLKGETGALVEKKEAIKVSIYDKGISELKVKYREGGLTIEECNNRIKEALQEKITELEQSSDPTAPTKRLLVKRIISEL